ncbi:hypothetical protein Q7F05_16865 [Pseudomonas sp. Lb2C1-1]|uniref:hypothetical protein n=1 Tax=Pseudomonas TaxID=286 RepID=UPI00391C57D8
MPVGFMAGEKKSIYGEGWRMGLHFFRPVKAGGADTYTVQSSLSPIANYANLRYTIGGKTCTFLATYVGTVGSGGSTIPKWNNTATPSGGAVCTAKVTSTNISTYAWSVEFTMK